MKRPHRLCAAALAACMCIACSSVSGGGWHKGADTFHAGAAIEPNSLNPILVTESIENEVDRLIFNGLTLVDGNNAIQPDLATTVPTLQNGGISADGKTVTYRLRKDVLWHDGARFTSADVAFTWKAIMNPNTRVGNRIPYEEVRQVDTPDDFTVVFHLKRRYAPFVAENFNSSTIAYVLPRHLLARYPDLNSVPFNHSPIGTGPYRVVRWIHGDRLELTRNERYFKGVPKIANFVLHEIPQENTGINQLRTHELDWYSFISEASYNVLRNVPSVRIVIAPANAYRGIYINTERPILRDVRVRQAIAYAIDKKELVDTVTHGTGTVATEDIPSFMWAYDRSVPAYHQDFDRARALLGQAGFKPGAGGVMYRNGQPLSFTFALRQGATGDTAMAVIIQSWLSKIGMKVSIKTYPGSMLFAVGPSGVLQPGKYDLDISGFTSPADPDNSAEFTCANRPPNGLNWTRYCSAEMDALQAQAIGTYDERVRGQLYAKIEQLLARDVPQVYIYYQPNINALNPALLNFRPSMITATWNAQEWEFAK